MPPALLGLISHPLPCPAHMRLPSCRESPSPPFFLHLGGAGLVLASTSVSPSSLPPCLSFVSLSGACPPPPPAPCQPQSALGVLSAHCLAEDVIQLLHSPVLLLALPLCPGSALLVSLEWTLGFHPGDRPSPSKVGPGAKCSHGVMLLVPRSPLTETTWVPDKEPFSVAQHQHSLGETLTCPCMSDIWAPEVDGYLTLDPPFNCKYFPSVSKRPQSKSFYIALPLSRAQPGTEKKISIGTRCGLIIAQLNRSKSFANYFSCLLSSKFSGVFFPVMTPRRAIAASARLRAHHHQPGDLHLLCLGNVGLTAEVSFLGPAVKASLLGGREVRCECSLPGAAAE